MWAAKPSSGCRSASKKSGDWRWAERFSVLDVHTCDLRRALERRALGFDGQLGSDLVELPLEPPGEVGNLEVDPRMHGVEVPRTGRGNDVSLQLRAHDRPSEALRYTCNCKHSTDWLLRMQVTVKSDLAGLLDRLVAHELPSRSGLEAWDSFL